MAGMLARAIARMGNAIAARTIFMSTTPGNWIPPERESLYGRHCQGLARHSLFSKAKIRFTQSAECRLLNTAQPVTVGPIQMRERSQFRVANSPSSEPRRMSRGFSKVLDGAR